MRSKRISLPPSLRIKVLIRDGHRCVYCGATADTAELHLDHVIPICKGGTNDIGNLVTACKDCNVGKGGRLLPGVDGDVHGQGDDEMVPDAAWAASSKCGDIVAAWLPQFQRWWPEVDVLPDTIEFNSCGEVFQFSPTFVCRGRAGCDIGPEVRVLVVEWFGVRRAPLEMQLQIRNAVISGYSVPTMILMGPPAFFYGVLVNERYKGNPQGRVINHFLQPFGEWENSGWYPDENMDFDDLRSPFFGTGVLKEASWDAEGERIVGVYWSFDSWGGADDL